MTTKRSLLPLALCAVLLAACGADGEPETPDRATPGVSVSGTVEIGLRGGSR
ncbi:hypothetical protein roselon_01484 [Roseibacterium elongatum DSM 19469]|uniref:Argininosuccinate lyase n=1 Tax=Roseicyclus elongatus DSM 19469 TaxID=1294273 RepID=W8S129_9RHOB|nr:argininosuccinate lyase [Roseibacterium elongatum]AHM03867.1 hypothetical protein roselon_01484 [Roseibacterium elongatum DSM 19469]